MEDLKKSLDKKGDELQDQIKTIKKFQPKYYEALRDRGTYESQRDKAFKERDKLQSQLTRIEAHASTLTNQRSELEAELRKLTDADRTDISSDAERVIILREARSKATSFENQLKSAREDLSFAQMRYQDASDKAATLGKENAELKLEVQNLEARASENVVRIRKIQAENTQRELRKMWQNEHTIRLDREREIERLTEELKAHKSRFSGRETRGSSVPRSPRLRQIGSRNTSPVGDNSSGSGGNGNGNGGGIGSLFGPRGAHLRDL